MPLDSYVVLARKWRPAQFSDIVGQEHVVRTLMNAIRSGRISQAYLFTGSRGVGKTSIARIVSKAIRCESPTDINGAYHSCDACSHCTEITRGSSVDVLEIDGASNNGVEAVRDIRDAVVKYLPASGKRKIYIIDEVHMLTTAAFNALLKTLEEPPAHVIFILATTEPHKIPATILSRCQRFDFRRVTSVQIQSRLALVAKAEGLTAEPQALTLIARAAEGSMRDALSLLDQVIAYAGDRVTLEAARDSIGLIPNDLVLGALSALMSRNAHGALESVNQAYARGYDLKLLVRSLIEFLYYAILAKVGAPLLNTELSLEETESVKSTAALRELEELEMIFQALHQGADWIAKSAQPKIVMDILMIKCALADTLVALDQIPTTPVPATVATPVAAPTPAPIPTPIKSADSTQARSWSGFTAFVKTRRPILSSILEYALTPVIPDDHSNAFRIPFTKQDAHRIEQLSTPIYKEQTRTLAKEYFGRDVNIYLEISETGGEGIAHKKVRTEKEREAAVRGAIMNNPAIQEAQSLFGAELSSIDLFEDESHGTL